MGAHLLRRVAFSQSRCLSIAATGGAMRAHACRLDRQLISVSKPLALHRSQFLKPSFHCPWSRCWSSSSSRLVESIPADYQRPSRNYHCVRRSSSSAAQGQASSVPEQPAYEPPRSGLLSLLPPAMVPYAELIRLDKPTGTYYLYFPCLFSTLGRSPRSPNRILTNCHWHFCALLCWCFDHAWRWLYY